RGVPGRGAERWREPDARPGRPAPEEDVRSGGDLPERVVSALPIPGRRSAVKAGRASSTAGVVASGVLFVHHEPGVGHLVSKEAAEAILRLLRARSPLKAASLAGGLPHAWFRLILRFVENRMMPGLMLHHAVRKCYIDDDTRRALAEGAIQVVVLGAGLDTLALQDRKSTRLNSSH